jgi:hypothetical protein
MEVFGEQIYYLTQNALETIEFVLERKMADCVWTIPVIIEDA